MKLLDATMKKRILAILEQHPDGMTPMTLMVALDLKWWDSWRFLPVLTQLEAEGKVISEWEDPKWPRTKVHKVQP